MKHVLHRAAPPVLKDLNPENSVWRVALGLLLFAAFGIGATLIVMTKELLLAAVGLCFLWSVGTALATRIRKAS
jgi:hypothetical protein